MLNDKNYFYTTPSVDLLTVSQKNIEVVQDDINDMKEISRILKALDIDADLIDFFKGPTLKSYFFKVLTVGAGTKITRINNELKLILQQPNINTYISDKGLAIEIPLKQRETVNIRSIIETKQFSGSLPLALGMASSGEPVCCDLSKAPHMLIAGTTGSGKSVCINSIIISLLMKNAPSDLLLTLVDPKRTELTNYNGIPHLTEPVITNTGAAIKMLYNAINDMNYRYNFINNCGCRSIDELPSGTMPRRVIIIDELADLMLTSKEQIEMPLTMLAQKARGAGIHLILATQRPQVKVIPGVLKANIPVRIAFTTASITDSKVILDYGGAEKLQGKGDGLYCPIEGGNKRFQSCYVSDNDINNIINYCKYKAITVESV